MFSYENEFAKLQREFQIRFLSNKKYQKEYKLFQNNTFEMNLVDLYCLAVTKWFNNFIKAFEFFENENIIHQEYEVTENTISNVYDILIRDLRDHVINIASYHDLLLHLLNEIYEIKSDSKNLSWDYIAQGICEESVKQQMTKIYSYMRKEIPYRNAVLHDMNFLWIDNYLTIEMNQLCSILQFDDDEMKKLLDPLREPICIRLRSLISQIQNEEKERFNNIKKETEKLFVLLCNPYNKRIKSLMK